MVGSEAQSLSTNDKLFIVCRQVLISAHGLCVSIQEPGDSRGDTLAWVRQLILDADREFERMAAVNFAP